MALDSSSSCSSTSQVLRSQACTTRISHSLTLKMFHYLYLMTGRWLCAKIKGQLHELVLAFHPVVLEQQTQVWLQAPLPSDPSLQPSNFLNLKNIFNFVCVCMYVLCHVSVGALGDRRQNQPPVRQPTWVLGQNFTQPCLQPPFKIVIVLIIIISEGGRQRGCAKPYM